MIARGPSEPVWVTGLGFITPLGNDEATFDAALFEGRSAVAFESMDVQGLDATPVPLARSRFDAASVQSVSRIALDRGTAMALDVSQRAMERAGLAASAPMGERLGVFWGSGIGGCTSFDATAAALYGEHRRLRPTTVLTVMPNAAAAEIALATGAQGAAISYACACASSAVAIGEAMRAIRAGWIDVAIAGGHETMLTPGLIGAWQAMRVLAPPPRGQDSAEGAACRPFSADRAGFALGEGAAALVLESAAHARARGADARHALVGYATNCDATHITHPDAASQARAMHAALRDAGLDARDIACINAHGTATQAGDAAEAASIHAVFGARTPVTGSKSIHGHLMGAGGAVELVATLRSLDRQCVPPIANLRRPDAAFDVDFVMGASREAPTMRHALSNSFAFGGTNAVLIASSLAR